MTTISNNNHNNLDDDIYWANSSPKRAPSTQQVLPDSPDYIDKYATNSDDLHPTSQLTASSVYLRRPQQLPLVIVGSHEHPVTLGRGGACTVKIGRRNRQISRIHVSIAFNTDKERFELTVVGLNGACVDDVQYEQHAVAPLEEDSFVDVLGDQFQFKLPAPVSSTQFVEKLMKQEQEQVKKIKRNTDILREMSPEAEEQPQPQPHEEEEVVVEEEENDDDEEESYPVELVPEDELSSIEKESSPEQQEEEQKQVLQEKKQPVEQDTHDYAEVIIDALVFSRTSSMPISDICSRILKANPVYAKQPRELWIERIRAVLKEKPFFGEIQRKGKTADGSPTENLYYYNSELDPVEWRRTTYTQVGRSARKCTLKDKQYFWKIPPKLGRHRSSYIPPPATTQRGGDENVDPKKTRS